MHVVHSIFRELDLAPTAKAICDRGDTCNTAQRLLSNCGAMLLLHGSVVPAPRSLVRSRCGSGTFHATGELRASAEVAAFGAAGAPRVSLTCQQGRVEEQTRA